MRSWIVYVLGSSAPNSMSRSSRAWLRSWLSTDPEAFRFGTLDPAEFDVFVVKSRVHFRRGFDETGFTPTIIVVEAPGPFVGTTYLDALPLENVDLSVLYPYGTPPGR